MKKNFLILFLFTLPLSYVSAQENVLNQLKQSYLHKRDYKSLKKLSTYLKQGMSQEEVESLLGKPDYSPGEGNYYYSSKKLVKVEGTVLRCPMGLDIRYYSQNDQKDHPNPKFKIGELSGFSLLPLCE